MVGSKIEDAWEINDPDSQLIIQVDPSKKEGIIEGILAALSRPRGVIQQRLEQFYFNGFKVKFHEIITDVIQKKRIGPVA